MLHYFKKFKCELDILNLNKELHKIEIKKLNASLSGKNHSDLELDLIRIETEATKKRAEIIEKRTEMTLLTIKNNVSYFLLLILALVSAKYFFFQ